MLWVFNYSLLLFSNLFTLLSAKVALAFPFPLSINFLITYGPTTKVISFLGGGGWRGEEFYTNNIGLNFKFFFANP